MSIIGYLPDAMPGDRVNIVDNSGYADTAPSELKDPIALMGFVSPKGVGPDETLVTITGSNVDDYGIPNYNKYGVSLYNVHNYILGGGTVIGMRLVAPDSAMANIIVLAKYKIVTAEPVLDENGAPLYTDAEGKITTIATGNTALTKNVLKVALATSSVTGSANAGTKESLMTAMEALKTDVEDTNGFKTIPLFALYNKSKGNFGNNISFRISFDTTMEAQDSENRFYKITMADMTTGMALGDGITFTFNPDYLYNGIESMYLPDAFDSYSKYLGAVMSSSFQTFMNMVTTSGVYSVDNETSCYQIDILFGLTKTGTHHYLYELDTTSVSLSPAAGLPLAGGSDGSFDPNSDATTRATAISTEMAKLYNGEITDLIYDETRYPFIHVFDNDDSKDVKDAVNNLVNKKYTPIGLISAPATCKTYTEVDSLKASQFKYDTFSICEHSESAMIIDPYTNKRIRMPASYFDSYAMAAHCANKGYAIPFAGKFYQWTGFIAGTMLPQSTSLDVLKNEYTNRMNQMFEDGKGNARSYEQITMQSKLSSLSELNNVHILKMMIRYCLEVSEDSRWDFNTDNDIKKYQQAVKDKIDVNMSGLYETVDIVCTRESANGAGANRIKAQLNIKFKNILKGVTYWFYIN